MGLENDDGKFKSGLSQFGQCVFDKRLRPQGKKLFRNDPSEGKHTSPQACTWDNSDFDRYSVCSLSVC